MTETNIETIAKNLAARVKDDKLPYLSLKWVVENCDFQYKATKDELWQAYFAAINMLKAQGVENSKRLPYSNLNPSERRKMRRHAKLFSEALQKVIGCPVKPSRSPRAHPVGNRTKSTFSRWSEGRTYQSNKAGSLPVLI